MPKNECINNIETNEGKMKTRPVKNSVARFGDLRQIWLLFV